MTSSLLSLLPPTEVRAKYRVQVKWGRVEEEKEFLIKIWICSFLVLNKTLKTTHAGRIFPALKASHFQLSVFRKHVRAEVFKLTILPHPLGDGPKDFLNALPIFNDKSAALSPTQTCS